MDNALPCLLFLDLSERAVYGALTSVMRRRFA